MNVESVLAAAALAGCMLLLAVTMSMRCDADSMQEPRIGDVIRIAGC